MDIHYFACLAFAALWSSALMAGDFVNLDFEHPNLSHATPDPVIPGYLRAPASEALQGWSLTADGFPAATIYVTPPGGSKPPVALTGGLGMLPGTGVDLGKYELYLDKPSQVPGSLDPIYRLSQLGTIPAGATIFDIAGFVTAPEPSTYALVGMGAVALWWQCRRTRT